MELSAEQREKVSVGVVPMGTGNDFVSNFTDKERFFNIEAQIKGSAYEIDLVKCNDLYSVNMVNVGFDSHVVCKKERLGKKKWMPRKLSYIAGLVITLVRKPGLKVDLSRDGEKPEKRDLLLTTLANGAFCGGGFNSNPKASLTDGNIDCITINNVSRLKFLSLVGKYKSGTHLSGKFDSIISHFKCRKADLVFSEETPVSVDGERVGTVALAPYTASLGKLDEGEHLVEITAFGNRFNTFAALHMVDPACRWYGPDAWRRKGTRWSYEYNVKPSGITTAPTLVKFE